MNHVHFKILTDPGVEAGVFEVPAEKLAEYGHGCDFYDVAAVLHANDDLFELQADVLGRARHAIVVNADDPLCMAMRSRASAPRHVLVTSDPSSVSSHRDLGGEAVYLDHVDGQHRIIIAAGNVQRLLISLEEDVHGSIDVMCAVALAWVQGVGAAIIREAIGSWRIKRQTLSLSE